MQNRNTKDPAENHIYQFTLSIIMSLVGIFFSLNDTPEAANLLYSLSINLFISWCIFYLSERKKLKNHSEYFHNLIISISFIGSVSPIVLLMIPYAFFNLFSSGLFLLTSFLLSLIINKIIQSFFTWEKQAELHLIEYRMNITDKKEKAFIKLKHFIDQSNRNKMKKYLEKALLFDKEVEEYLNKNSKQH